MTPRSTAFVEVQHAAQADFGIKGTGAMDLKAEIEKISKARPIINQKKRETGGETNNEEL